MLAATVDGARWSAGTGNSDLFGLLQSGTAFIIARRLEDGGQTEELIQIEFETANPFQSATYTLTGGPAAFAVFTVRTGLPQTEAVYGTTPEHTGSLTIEAADAADSVMVGSFAFEAQQLGGTALRRVAGRFRVRFSMSVPLVRRAGGQADGRTG